MDVTADHAHQAEVLLNEVEDRIESNTSAVEGASVSVLVALAQVHATLTVAQELRVIGKALQEGNAPVDLSASLRAVESFLDDEHS